jgi:hypothetical protein
MNEIPLRRRMSDSAFEMDCVPERDGCGKKGPAERRDGVDCRKCDRVFRQGGRVYRPAADLTRKTDPDKRCRCPHGARYPIAARSVAHRDPLRLAMLSQAVLRTERFS